MTMKKLKIVTLMGFVVPLLAACGGSHESAEGQPHRLADTGWVTMSGEDLYFRGQTSSMVLPVAIPSRGKPR